MQAPGLGLPATQGLLSTSSAACYLPLAYNGSQINTCVTINGNATRPVCWVKNQGWQVGPVNEMLLRYGSKT
jgi:hypothetical protein